MTRATSAITFALALALCAALGGCETDGDGAAENWPLWPTISAPDPSGASKDGGERANTASPPAAVANPPPVVTPVEPPAKSPAMILRNDPMVLKKALQDGEAAPVSLPREAMARLFRTLAAFQPTAQHLQIIEAYGRQLAGPEQARLQYELQSCQAAPACVVVPQR